MLVYSPLLMGSNRALFWALNAFCAGLALLLYCWSEITREQRVNSDWSLHGKLFILYVAPLLWMLLQFLPVWPIPLAHPAWSDAGRLFAPLTAEPYATFLAFVWWLPLALAFVMVRAATREGGSIYYLRLMLAVSVSVAVFGLLNLYFEWQTVGLVAKQAYLPWLTGTFINRNTAASFFVIGLAIGVSLLMRNILRTLQHARGKNRFAMYAALFSQWSLFYFVCIFLLAISLLLTGSRAGIVSGLVAGVLVVGVFVRETGISRVKLFSIALVVLLLLALGASAISNRAADGLGSNVARYEYLQEAAKLIMAKPLAGHGAGSYQAVEPSVRLPTAGMRTIINRAHNSFVEAATTLGLPFTLGWLALLVMLLVPVFRRGVSQARHMPATIVVFAVALAEGAHAVVDFSFQNQAIAIYAAALLGLALGEFSNAPEAGREIATKLKTTLKSRQAVSVQN